MLVRRFIPPVVWMAVIFTLSTSLFGSCETGSVIQPILRLFFPSASKEFLDLIHAAIRKAAHFTEYAVLSALWYRALVRGAGWNRGRSLSAAFVISALYACSDEWHQSFVPNRTASAMDALLDTAGAASAMLIVRLRNKKGRGQKPCGQTAKVI